MDPGDGVRVDERDTMFARAARRPGTPAFDDYYARRPELRSIDDRIRGMPDLCRPGGLHYVPRIAEETERWFRGIDEIRPDRSVVETWRARIEAAADATAAVKKMLLSLGAVAAGCCRIEPEFVYTVKGRFDADYGRRVRLDHSFAAVFLVEMDHAAMRRAPGAETIRESARQYYRAARISVTAAATLRSAGHDAKSHHDAHYDVILPPLAVSAGLGELGRNNILVADRFGSRVRIGAVSTELRLRPDAPADLGVAAFCEVCGKCAENCPPRALSTGGREVVRGVAKWPTRVERCYRHWRRLGTDCGICMACCPFSHENNGFHNLVRRAVRRLVPLHPLVPKAMLLGDDVVYGRAWRPLL